MKLITWNVQWCRGCDGRVDPRRIVDHARALADFDVLCLQEVADNFPDLAGSVGEDQFQELSRPLPGFHPVPGIAVDILDGAGGRRRFGNLVLSRLPVLRILRHQLPWPPAAARPGMPRLLIEATIQSPIGCLRVMTTHLEYYCATHDLHHRMQTPLDARTPALLDAWQLVHPAVAHQHTNGVHDRVQWPTPHTCDFIYVSEDLRGRVRRVVVNGETQASDHQPMLIELR